MCSFDEWYEGREWCRNWKSDAQTAWDAALEAAARVAREDYAPGDIGYRIADAIAAAIERLKEEG